MNKGKRKIKEEQGGVNRATAILLLLIGIMLVILAVPAWNRFRFRSEKTACEQAIKSAGDGLIIEYLSRGGDAQTLEEARESLDQIMVTRPGICPAGGNVYLVPDENGIFVPICGLHSSDLKQRTRLNASRAMTLVTENLIQTRRRAMLDAEHQVEEQELAELEGRENAQRENEGAEKNQEAEAAAAESSSDTEINTEVFVPEPDSVMITLNGKDLKCIRVKKEVWIRRGTRTTSGYNGVIAFFGLGGEGDFADKGKKGEICYFAYADEEEYAVWRSDDGWTGSAYTK
ncbi:MAG: hypothetical protein IKE58_10275 [Blautia sp.]|nr:hypothetical protein [Blautia sp.]